MPTQSDSYTRFSLRLLLLSLLLLSASSFARAQEGTSTAAAARARYLSESGLVPASREIAVEEFVNYHRHQIGRPKAGEAVLLDVRWGNDVVSSESPEAVLQIGFSTALAGDRPESRAAVVAPGPPANVGGTDLCSP